MNTLASMALCIGIACAFPSMRERIPNGFRVPCPPGVDGCDDGDSNSCQPQTVCNGVGHQSCQGGSMPLNPFGQAWRDATFVWTRELCEMDSDGDGLTNGQELGDPCCLWRRNDEPSAYMKSFAPSHPGMANTASEIASMPNVTECDSTASSATGFPMNEFNPGEEQLVMDFFVDNYEVTSDRTTYVDVVFNIPMEVLNAHEKYHAVWATAIVDKVANLHHYVIRPCAELWPEELDGQALGRTELAVGECADNNWGAWAPGSDVVSTPAWAGRPFGRAVGIVSFTVNIHYDNPLEQSGIVDSSGFRVWYTPTLRQHNIAHISTTSISVNPTILIPPALHRWFLTRECVLDVRDQETGEPAEMHLVGVSYHAHLLGREMYTEYWPVGEEEPFDLASEPVWHFDDQGARNIINWNVSLRTGDRLQTTCVMDSRSRSMDTIIGRETTDEMCWASFSGWPSTPNGIVSDDTVCTGRVWSGTLANNEPGFGIATRHPEAEARDVWDGTSRMNAGEPLRIQGRPPVVIDGCDDVNSRVCSMLSASGLDDDPNFSCTGPLSNVQAISDRFDGNAMTAMSVLELCCATACRGLCADEAQCQVDDSTPMISHPLELSPESWANLRIRSMAACDPADPADPLSVREDVNTAASSAPITHRQGASFFKCLAFFAIFGQALWA